MVKKLLMIWLTLIPAIIVAQNEKNVISVNALGAVYLIPAYKTLLLNFNYERAIAKRFSLVASLETGRYDEWILLNDYHLTVSGIGFLFESRVYPLLRTISAPKGLFTGVYFKGYIISDLSNLGGMSFGPASFPLYPESGIVTGYKFGKNRLTIEPLVGFGYFFKTYDMSEFTFYEIYTYKPQFHLRFRLELNIGFMF